jgi:hypothetical protein
MEKINYRYFTESLNYDIENEEDVIFMQEFKDPEKKISLISKSGDQWKINFVGEVKTPNCVYFSFPKNVYQSDIAEDQINKYKQDLLKVLSLYKKDPSGKTLSTKIEGDYNSERVYFDRLKKYFLDFITYEFIYPQKTKSVHSNIPKTGGRISVFDTIRNRKRYGSGITYKVKDVSNSDDWMLDDVYYHTLKNIQERIGATDQETKEIQNMCDYLDSEGYKINKIDDNKILSNDNKVLLDMNNISDVIKIINKSDVNIIHLPIKNTLIEYYNYRLKATSLNSINVIFTLNFEKVWEMMLQKSLQDESSNNFKDELKDKFNKFEIIEKFIPLSQLSNYENLPEGEYDDNLTKWIQKRGPRYFLCERTRLLIPDIFVELEDGRRFIGDAKYYKDSNSNYDKEFYIYNDAQSNEYPMVVFAIPDSENIDKTSIPRNGYRRAKIDTEEKKYRELIIITVSVKDIIDDSINGSRKVLKDSIKLIEKYTRKSNWEKIEKY